MASSTETGVKLLTPVVETRSSRWDAGVADKPVLAWGVLGFVTFVVEVLLLGGLRGSASGISGLIDALTALGALLTQLLFVSGVILVVHLELLVLRSAAPLPLRALTVPVTSVLCTLLMNAAVGELAVLPLLLFGVLASGLALATGIARGLEGGSVSATRRATSRRVGILLILTSVAALLWAAARVSAWQATTLEPPPFDSWSPWLATAAWAVSAIVTFGAFAFLTRTSKDGERPRLPLTRPPLTPLLLCLLATTLSWLVTRPRTFDEPTWQVFLARAAQGLFRTPLPAVPPFFVAVEHLLGLAVAAWALTHRSLPPTQKIALGFCLLALRAPDTPLLALVLTVGALWVAIRPPAKRA